MFKKKKVIYINIFLKTPYDNIYQLLEFYDVMKKYCELFGDFSRVFKVCFNNISAGELQLINTYAGIYYALTNTYQNQKSAIILLDEPDQSFHPR